MVISHIDWSDYIRRQGWSLICPRELPVEWEDRAEKEELEISVEDLTEENYVPKKKAFHPFSGRGYRLGR